MPTMTSYVNGTSAGMGGGNPSPKKRGEVNGWSAAAVRRHTRWLYSIEPEKLSGTGIAVTLTVRDIPESSAVFHAARAAFLKRMERIGMVRFHWVIEWTRRRRPHLHMALYFDVESLTRMELAGLESAAIGAWLDVADQWGTEFPAQYVAEIDGALGWLQYLSKHAARGAAHYQRQGKPDGWEKTGRLWGHSEDWPEAEPLVMDVSRPAYWRFRRLVRSWRVADAREALRVARDEKAASAARRRLVSARRMLSCDTRKLSEVRGISEWIPEGTMAQFLVLLAEEGHTLAQR